jgi:hypothetical protein
MNWFMAHSGFIYVFLLVVRPEESTGRRTQALKKGGSLQKIKGILQL